MYEYRDSPLSKTLASKALTDTTSIRSPSSLATTQKTGGSQSSLKSAISLKETNGGGTLPSYSRPPRSEASVVPSARVITNGAAVASLNQPKSAEEKRLLQREPIPLSSTPVPIEQTNKPPSKPLPSSRSTTPVPSARTTTTTATLSSAVTVQPLVGISKSQSRTQVIEGVPQTSV